MAAVCSGETGPLQPAAAAVNTSSNRQRPRNGRASIDGRFNELGIGYDPALGGIGS